MPIDDTQKLLQTIAEVLNENSEQTTVTSGEKSDSGNRTISGFSRTAMPDLSWAKGDGSILDWAEKFARQKEGQDPYFQPGEYIKVQGFVREGPDGGYKIHIDADGRIADNFFLKLPENNEADPLANMKGMPLELILEVGEERKEEWRVSNIYNFDAKLAAVYSTPPINPNVTEYSQIQTGKRVIIKGEFRGFNGQTAGEWYDKHTSGIVKTDDGREILIEMPTGQVSFSAGELENLVGNGKYKQPEPGDQVTIGAYVTRRKRRKTVSSKGVEAGPRLAVSQFGPCYLDQPSKDRARAYGIERNSANTEIDNIEKAINRSKFPEARELIARSRYMELTKSELSSVRDLTESITENERPVQSPIKNNNREGRVSYHVKEMDKAYGTLVESMTKAEFVDFAMVAVTGEKRLSEECFDNYYLFSTAQDFGVDAETIESLAYNCVEKRLPKIMNKHYDHDIDWDNKYNIERGIDILASLGTESSSKKVFDYLKMFVEKESYNKAGWREELEKTGHREEKFLFNTVQAISMSRQKIPFTKLVEELDYMKRVSQMLEENADEAITLRILNTTIKYVDSLVQTQGLDVN